MIGTLLAGELRHHLRDRVTVAVMVLGQGLLFPFAGLALQHMQRESQAAVDAAPVVIAVVGDPARLAPYTDENTRVIAASDTKSDVLPDATVTLSAPGEPFRATVASEAGARNGMTARTQATTVAEDAGRAERRAILVGAGAVDPERVVGIVDTDTVLESDRALRRAAGVVPALLMLLVASGGIYTALDVVTGEKERGTAETLLTTAAPRRDIAVAKFLAVLVLVLLASVVSLTSMWLTSCTSFGAAAVGFTIPARSYALALLLFLPLAATLAAVLTAAASRVSDFKSGQVYALPALIVPIALAAVAMAPEATLTPLVALLPITNLSVALKEVLLGTVQAGPLALGIVASAVYAGGALWATTRWLGREEVLLGDVGGRHRRLRGDYTPDALAVFALGLGSLWFLASPAQTADFAWGMAFTQVGLFVPLALGATWFFGLPWRDALGLRLPKAVDVGWGLLAGALCPAVGLTVAHVQERFLPASPTAMDALNGMIPELPLPLLLLLVAVLPGVCEELLFRGTIQGLLGRSLRPVVAAVLTAVAFGLFHLSLFRVLPTAVLGLIFGVARFRSGSVLIPMGMHLLNNGLLVGAGVAGLTPVFGPELLPAVVGVGFVLWRMGKG